MKKKIVVLMLALASGVFSVSARDILSLKNGSVIKGELIEATGEQVKFKTADGSLWVYGMSEVISVTKEKQAEETVAEETEAAPKKKKEFSKKGYRTQIEQTLEFGDFVAFGYDAIFGYQFNSHLQLGAGAGFRFLEDMYGDRSVPLHIDLKVNILKTKVTPFLDFKGGAMMFVDEKIGSSSFYLSPSVGIKKHYSEARSLSFSAGWTIARYYEDVCSGCSGDGDDAFFNGGAFSFKVNYQF